MTPGFRRTLTSTAMVIAGVYLVLSLYLYARQADFLFFPQRDLLVYPKDYGCDYSDVRLPVEGAIVHGWWLPAPPRTSPVGPGPSGRTLLYLHGNGGNVGANAEHACRLNRIGFTVFIFDYRGYGQSDPPPNGKIHERTIYADGEAAWRFLTAEKKVAPRDLVLYGHSLGGAVAIELAQRHPDAGALIAESTFTSLRDMADKDPVFRLFPIGLILDHKMESEEKLRKVQMPVLLIHGAADTLILPAMSERLYAAAPGRKDLYVVPGAGHDNVAATAGAEYSRRITGFLDGNR